MAQPTISPTRAHELSNTRRTMRAGRKSFRAAQAFYLTLFILTCLATLSLFTNSYPEESALGTSIHRRNEVSTFASEEEQCRLVHHAKDQCAFIKKQCGDDEPGFSAYLDLYFCQLPHAKAAAFLILVAWLGLLFSTIGIAASDFFCINLNTIAGILGMSESMAGVTLLAFGNGSPDVFSTFAAMSTNSGNLAVGELFGAAGFITAVVAGSMALIKPFKVSRKSFIRDVGFFVVAAAFSMVFLWDGRLHLWECLTMVAFYVCYVLFVVLWHWWIGRRRKRREKEAAARGHFIPVGDELEDEESYRDDLDENDASPRPEMVRGVSNEDWSALERGGAYNDGTNEDEEEEERDRWMSDLATNMRLTRPSARSRKNTLSTVRPSLVGALEFQAVLKSLQKSRNMQTIPMNARRYSDDPSFTTAQQQDQMSTLSDPAARPPYQITVDEGGSPTTERATLDVPRSAPARTRAISANGAEGLQIDSDLQRRTNAAAQENLIDISDFGAQPQQPVGMLDVPGRGHTSQPQSPSVALSPASPRPDPMLRVDTDTSSQSFDHLAPPSAQSGYFRQDSSQFLPRALRRTDTDSPAGSPRTVPSAHQLPKISIPREGRSRASSRASSPFPPFMDHPSSASSRAPSLNLPPASIASPESVPESQNAVEESKRPTLLTKYWPHSVLPPPGVIISALLPTIYHWPEKNWWEKSLGLVAAPSVFLLTVTLPVVESNKDEEDDLPGHQDYSMESARSKSMSAAPGPTTESLKGVGREDHNGDVTPGTHRHSLATPGMGQGVAAVAAEHENHHLQAYHDNPAPIPSIAIDQPAVLGSPGPMPSSDSATLISPSPELWNRWLTIIQLFLAPLFIVFAIYSQAGPDLTATWLIKPVLISLLISLVLLIPFLLTTTPTHRPKIYRTLLSLVGFVVSIAWISTIAAQVVGALKALAVILNMSHAIMGLTIFAVGNSLGDLVADVTVARLGYPVMALSACFGGPMLNILLGIGLSGSYILIRGAEHRQHKHPHKGLKFHSYHIEVSETLMVSGATLLVTLVGLLIFVPLNKWTMSRRIGWVLIAVWVISTIGNVVLEWTGWASGGKEG